MLLSIQVSEVSSMWLVPEQNDTAPVHILAPRMRFLDPPAPPGFWDSAVMEGEWKYLTDKHTSENLTGLIVCYPLQNGETQEGLANLFKDKGIVAMFTLFRVNSDYPGAGNWVRSGEKTRQPFPIYEITIKQNQSLNGWYSNQTRIMMRITFDHNPWDNTFSIALPIVGTFILVFAGGTCIIAVWKLTLIILRHGFQISMAQITLWINIVGCLLRMIFGAADPFGAYGTTSFLFSQIFLTISCPSVVSGALLISLYWHEMIHQTGKKKISLFLGKLRWIFLGITAIVHAFELTTATLRGAHYSFTLVLFLDGSMYVVISLAVFIFFIVTRYRLQKIFDKINSGLKSRKGQRLSLATFQLQAIVVMMVFFLIFLVLVGTTNLVWTPISFPIMWVLLFLIVQLIGLFQVLLINAPQVPLKDVLRGIMRPELLHKHLFNATSAPSATASGKSLQNISLSYGSGSNEVHSQVQYSSRV